VHPVYPHPIQPLRYSRQDSQVDDLPGQVRVLGEDPATPLPRVVDVQGPAEIVDVDEAFAHEADVPGGRYRGSELGQRVIIGFLQAANDAQVGPPGVGREEREAVPDGLQERLVRALHRYADAVEGKGQMLLHNLSCPLGFNHVLVTPGYTAGLTLLSRPSMGDGSSRSIFLTYHSNTALFQSIISASHIG